MFIVALSFATQASVEDVSIPDRDSCSLLHEISFFRLARYNVSIPDRDSCSLLPESLGFGLPAPLSFNP